MKKLNYSKPIILIGNSPFDISNLKSLPKHWPIFAADGGANALIENKIDFEAIIGDLDSYDNLNYQTKIPKIYLKDQNTTDLQKCLNHLNAPYMIGLGFLDRRIDHTLASCSAVCGPHFSKKIILLGYHDVLIWSNESWGCSIPEKTRVSIWPLGKQLFIDSRGLKWSLKGLKMSPDGLIGISNITTDKNFFIKIDKKYRPKYITLLPNEFFMEALNIIN